MTALIPEATRKTPIASLLTAHGRGAVATIAVRGNLEQLACLAEKEHHHFFSARNKKPIHQQIIGKVLFGSWREEELVVCRSAEDEIEIHCHGGEAAIFRILSDLENLGVTVLDWETYLEQTTDLWEADYLRAISSARTFRTAELLLGQRQIGKSVWQELAKCQNANDWKQLGDEKRSGYRETITQMQTWSDFGRHLVVPWSIVIGGVPNVGKSSLINAILGYQRAIVIDQPGTTRDVVTGETAIQGWPVLLSDTAGQRDSEDVLESAGIDRAIRALQKADLQILLMDRSSPPDEQTQVMISNYPNALFVFNKIDVEANREWAQMTFHEKPLNISCKTGEGIELLIQAAMQKLIPQLPPAKQVVPVTERQEQLLGRLGTR